MLQQHVAADQQIGGVQVLIRCPLALLCRMKRFGSFLVACSEIVGRRSVDNHSSVDDLRTVGVFSIAHQKVLPAYHHVTVDEQQPFVLRLLSQEVADGSASCILLTLHELAVRQLADGTIRLQAVLRSRTVIGNDDFVVDG